MYHMGPYASEEMASQSARNYCISKSSTQTFRKSICVQFGSFTRVWFCDSEQLSPFEAMHDSSVSSDSLPSITN